MYTRRLAHTSIITPKPTVAELPTAQIWFEYESGTTLKELSAKYGASQATIFRTIQGLDQ